MNANGVRERVAVRGQVSSRSRFPRPRLRRLSDRTDSVRKACVDMLCNDWLKDLDFDILKVREEIAPINHDYMI